jgi:prepilin-type N-terminal cleavage/methylation domain-containing protein
MGLRLTTIRRHSDEGGFTLIESMAALILLGIVLIALTSTMVSGYGALRTTKEEQQAVGVGSEALEWARSVSFDALAMREDDATIPSDSRMTSCAAPTGYAYAFDPDGAATQFACEPVVSSTTGGAVDIHKTTVTVDGEEFVVSKYVTWVDIDGGDVKDVKRFTAIVEWTSRGNTRTYRSSTLISKARKGLPTPSFVVSPMAVTKVVSPGNQAVFQHTIQNNGVLDRYDISYFVHPDRSWVPEFYKDVNNNNQYDGPTVDEFGNPVPAIDTAMVDTDADGTVDTGNLTTNATFKFFVIINTSASDVLDTEPVNIMVTSGIDGTVEKTAVDKVKVGDANLHLYLQNYPSPATGTTVSQRGLAMIEDTPPAATTLYNYSTDVNATSTGRTVLKGGNKDTSDLNKFVSWNYQMPERTLFNGNAVVTIWAKNVLDAAHPEDCTKKIRVKAALRTKASSTTDSKISDLKEEEASISTGSCTTWQQATITLAIGNKWVEQDQWLELKIFHPGDTDAVMYAYDTVDYPAKVVLPQVLS